MPPDPPITARTYKSYKAPGTRPPPIFHEVSATDYNLQNSILRHTLVIYSVVLSLSLERTILQNLFRRKDRTNTNRPRYKLEYSNGNKVL